MSDKQINLQFGHNAGASVDAYLEYRRWVQNVELHFQVFLQITCFKNTFLVRIVGDDDGGKLFTPEEYEEYKRKVVPGVFHDFQHEKN